MRGSATREEGWRCAAWVLRWPYYSGQQTRFAGGYVATFKTAVAGMLVLLCCTAFADTARWPEKKAADWYAAQRWLVGSDYIPADAINQLEMWQADTFDPSRIDQE